MGNYIASRMGGISSDITYPVRNRFLFDDCVKNLKCLGSTGMTYIAFDTRMDDINNLNRVNRYSDLIINMLGPSRFFTNKYEHFKYINMDVPQKIARSARLTGAKKLIHFSAAGVSYNSDSLDLKTKFYGEQLVRDEFPDAIIIRPTTILSIDDYYLSHYYKLMRHWYSFIPVWDDCTALKQPIVIDDFVEAIMNAIKLDDIQGQTFEIGGPFQYSQKELLDVMMNAMCREFKIYKMNKKIGTTLGSYFSFSRMNREDIIKSGLDLIVKQENGEKNIHDLYVQPAPVVPFIKRFFGKRKDLHALKKEDYEA